MSDRSSNPLGDYDGGNPATGPDTEEEPNFGRVEPPKPTQYQESADDKYRFQSRNAYAGEDQVGEKWQDQRTAYPDADESVARVDDKGNLVDRHGQKVDTGTAERNIKAKGSTGEGRHIVALSGTGTLHVADEKAQWAAEALKLAIANSGGAAAWDEADDMFRFCEVLRALQELRFHHSSLVRGQAVAAAGEIAVEKGEIQTVSDKSGHYKPDFAMTAQMHDKLAGDLKFVPATQARDRRPGVGPSRADTVTWELGNYEGNEHKSDTRLSGAEMAGYLDDVPMDTLMAEAARAAAQGVLDAWDGTPPQPTWEKAYDAELQKLSALSERERYARVRELIETRHRNQRTVLSDVSVVWLRDPLDGSRQRERVEGRWTPMIRADSASTPRTDPLFRRITHDHNGWKHDLLAQKRWRYWRDGAWTERVHDNPSHSPTSEHPEYADADGQRVLNEVLGNHRLDSPTQGA